MFIEQSTTSRSEKCYHQGSDQPAPYLISLLFVVWAKRLLCRLGVISTPESFFTQKIKIRKKSESFFPQKVKIRTKSITLLHCLRLRKKCYILLSSFNFAKSEQFLVQCQSIIDLPTLIFKEKTYKEEARVVFPLESRNKE